MQDAIRAEADSVTQRLQDDLRSQNIPTSGITRNDPQTIEEGDDIEITIGGVPTDRVNDFKATLEAGFPEWLYSSVDSQTWKLNMRPMALARIKTETLNQSIATIENRVNGLGLTEPVIQQHGRADAEHEILVQLPGVSDPARVMNLLQMSAQLEIQEVRDGPYPTRQAALAAHSGVLPPNSEIRPYLSRDFGAEPTQQWYILNRTPVVTGRDLRNALATRDTQTGGWQTAFTLSRQAGARFGQFHRRERR